MKVNKYTLNEEDWKNQEQWRKKRTKEVHNDMVSFLESIKRKE